MKQYRYPGLSSFKTEQAGIFFGRDRETRELFHLISVEKSVVLFSKSGTGKSSLLQAGVMPLLLETDIVPVPIRLGDETQSPEAQFSLQYDIAWRRFMGLPEQAARDSSATETFWAQLQRSKFEKDGRVCTPLVILDQFEELFTLYPKPEQRRRFVEELAALIMEKMPPALRAHLRTALRAGGLSAAAVSAAEQSPAVRFVFSIRSDMLHFMDELSEQIPYILRSRYQLFGLDEAQATEAITAPAAAAGDGFICAPFAYSEEARQEIIAALSHRGVVESFQLQAICQALEEKMIREGGAQSVTPAFYGGPAGIKNMLEEFYRRRIEELPEADQLAARLVMEDALVNENKRRRSVDALDLLARPGVDQKMLDALEQRRLVRKEPRLDSFYYEISHDTLLDPVLALRKEREEKEAAEQRIAAEAAERERLRVEREKIRKARQRNGVFTAIALLLLGLAGWQTIVAWNAQEEARKMTLVAEESRLRATGAERKAIEKDSLAEIAKSIADEQTRIAELKTKESLTAKEVSELAVLEAKNERRKAEAAALLATEQTKIAALAQKTALSAEQAAALATAQALKQQQLAEAVSLKVVQNLLNEARTNILHLEYDKCFNVLTNATEFGQLEDSIGWAMLEPAYFFTECDSIAKAKNMARAAIKWLPIDQQLEAQINEVKNKMEMREALQKISAEHYQLFKERYFPTMVNVQGGKFQLGVTGMDAEVSSFKLAKTETTFWQFGLFWMATGRRIQKKSPSWGIDGDNPVVHISWYDAVAYANWLSNNESIESAISEIEDEYFINLQSSGYRLPTEAEWEFAARGGHQQCLFKYAGSDILEEVGWFVDNCVVDGVSRTHAVNRLKVNTLGLADMSGNVYEWCWDWYGDYPKTAAKDYSGPETGSLRVMRGGSWVNYAVFCRVSYRGNSRPGNRDGGIGFRVASTPQ